MAGLSRAASARVRMRAHALRQKLREKACAARMRGAHLCPQVSGAVSGAAEQRLNIAHGETSGRGAARCEPWEKRQRIRRAPPGVIERFQSPLTGLFRQLDYLVPRARPPGLTLIFPHNFLGPFLELRSSD